MTCHLWIEGLCTQEKALFDKEAHGEAFRVGKSAPALDSK